MKLASRMKDIAPFHVMELMAKAAALEAAGRSVIHFEVGEPDFATAEPILVAGQEFLRGGHVHYTAALRRPPLREAITGIYQQRFGPQVPTAPLLDTARTSAITYGVMNCRAVVVATSGTLASDSLAMKFTPLTAAAPTFDLHTGPHPA